MDVGIRYIDGRWPDLKSTFALRTRFFLSAVRLDLSGCKKFAAHRIEALQEFNALARSPQPDEFDRSIGTSHRPSATRIVSVE